MNDKVLGNVSQLLETYLTNIVNHEKIVNDLSADSNSAQATQAEFAAIQEQIKTLQQNLFSHGLQNLK